MTLRRAGIASKPTDAATLNPVFVNAQDSPRLI
jgi:hypothetical protein